MKTSFFRKNHLMRLALLLLPLLGRGLGGGCVLFAQDSNGVGIINLMANAGTVTFEVSWNKEDVPPVWSDTVWVWVDYNENGVMTRLPLLPGATLTATSAAGVGKVIEVPGNNQGVWVVGNARTQGRFSATVKLLTATAKPAGACAYASNYPPVGEYTATKDIAFRGTPQYTIVMKKDADGTTETRKSGSPFTVPAGYTVQSFTDKTGAPGKLNCTLMSGDIDFSAPASIPKGLGTSFAVTQSPALPGAAELTYTWSATGFTPGSGAGTSYAPTAPAAIGTYPVTVTAHSPGYCALSKTKDVTVIDCISSTPYDLKVSATAYCAGNAVTFALSNTTLGRTYRLYRGADAVGVITGTGSPATFTGALVGAGTYTAQVAAEGGNCAAVMTGVHTVSENALPANPAVTAASRCGTGTVVLKASSSGAVIDWYAASSGGTALLSGNNTYTTPSITANTTYYTQARNSTTGCLSTGRTGVTATVRTPGASGKAPDAECGCASGLKTCNGTCKASCSATYSSSCLSNQTENILGTYSSSSCQSACQSAAGSTGYYNYRFNQNSGSDSKCYCYKCSN